jgi:hypothetical protein
MPTATEKTNVVSLAGMPGNPAHDPTRKDKEGRGSLGDKALMDSIVIVAVAWLFLLFLAFSLRHHNV